MRVLIYALKVVVGFAQKFELCGFVVKARELFQWKRLLLLGLYFWGIPKAKVRSAVRQGVAEKRLCVVCMVTGGPIFSGVMTGKILERDAKMARGRFSEVPSRNMGSAENGMEYLKIE